MSSPLLLKEYRCTCGKLLFRGALFCSIVEIKCKRCSKVQFFKDSASGPHSFMFVMNMGGEVVDACEGVAVLGCSREYALGKSISHLLSLVRDSHYQEIITNGTDGHHVFNNVLILRDREVPLESHVVPVLDKKDARYTVFNIIK